MKAKPSDLIRRRDPRTFEGLVAATIVLLRFLLRSSDTHTPTQIIYIYIYIYICVCVCVCVYVCMYVMFLMYATVLSNITPFSCFQKTVFFMCCRNFQEHAQCAGSTSAP